MFTIAARKFAFDSVYLKILRFTYGKKIVWGSIRLLIWTVEMVN
jgi:hypothetical protein